MAKLLLVEDDNNLREIYEARLQAEGYTIATAKDGEEALVVAKAEHPDLIISDIMMPKISGFEMLDILRNTESLKSVPVIMLTALGQNDDQQRADKLGADRYLVKSQVTLEDIVKVAHELLHDTAPDTATSSQSAPTQQPSATAPDSSLPTAPVAVNEPVAPAPAPSTEESTTTSIPVVTTEPVTPITVSNAPQTDTEDESAQVGVNTGTEVGESTNIEDFVAGASQEAGPPPLNSIATPDDAVIDPPLADPQTASSPTTSPAATESTTPATAVQSTTPETPEPTTETPAANVAPPQEVYAETNPPLEETDDLGDESGTSPVVHDKVITPLKTDAKKDINSLLNLETAKEKALESTTENVASAGAGTPQVQVPEPASTGNDSTQQQTQPIASPNQATPDAPQPRPDLNNISL